MRYMKKIGFILAVISFLMLAACGGGNSNNSNNNNNNNNNQQQTNYSVSFITNGGSSVTTRIVTQGGAISTSPETTREGFVFDGWFTDNNTFANKVSFPYTPTGNITLYAKWTQLSGTYTVTFETNGGSYLPTLNNVTSISTEPTPSRSGYVFDGWFTSANLSGARITFPFTVTQNITLFAKWTQISDPSNPDGTNPIATEKASIKYKNSGGLFTLFVTFDNNGDRIRTDVFSGGSQISAIVDYSTKTCLAGWNNIEAGAVDDFLSDMFASGNIIDHDFENGILWVTLKYIADEDFYLDFPFFIGEEEAGWGAYRKEDRTIAGKLCKVYTLTLDGQQVTLASWNGLMMLYEQGGQVRYEAQATTQDVPDSAFTKTMDITWI